VCSSFIDVIDRESKHSSVQTAGAAESENEQHDYGYREFSGGDGSNSWASAGSQAMSYLANNDKSLETLHLFPSVKLVFMRYNAASVCSCRALV